jgi:FG-GAP repeat
MLIMPKLYFYVLGALALIAATIALAAPSLSKGNKWVEQAKLVSDNSAGEYEFAQAVAISGDTAVVGVPYYGELTDINNAGIITGEVSQLGETRNIRGYTKDGAAYVYHCSADTCALQAKLFLPKARTSRYSNFGSEVAIDGDTILVAADSPKKDVPELPVYIFTRSGDSWLLQAQLALPHPPQTSLDINSVALSGDTAVAGTDKNKVYVFRRHPATGTWSYEAELEGPRREDRFPKDSYFGNNVAIDGNIIIVSGGAGKCPYAYVFVRESATASWFKQAELTPYSSDIGYGTNVALSGNIAVIGSPGENWDRGAAYVYVQNSTTGKWFQQTKLVPNDVPPFFSYGFGGSVAIDGNKIVVGVSLEHKASPNLFQPNRLEKAVYVFERNSRIGWRSQPVKLLPQDYEQVARKYGKRVGISGERVIIAAGNLTTNSAYVFQRVDSRKQSIRK